MEKEKMLEKGKNYSYEELEKIVRQAREVTIKKLEQEFRKSAEKLGKEEVSVSSLLFTMQNMICASMMEDILLSKEEGEK